MKPIELKDSDPKVPQILLRLLYKADNPLKPVGYESCDFIPGRIIVRNGRRYMLYKDGSQRRIK